MPYKDSMTAKERARKRMRKMRKGVTSSFVTPWTWWRSIWQLLTDITIIVRTIRRVYATE